MIGEVEEQLKHIACRLSPANAATFFYWTLTFHMPHFTAMLLTLIGAFCAAIFFLFLFFT